MKLTPGSFYQHRKSGTVVVLLSDVFDADCNNGYVKFRRVLAQKTAKEMLAYFQLNYTPCTDRVVFLLKEIQAFGYDL